jgi:5-methylcytosine-specific restriction endonuclease McrA
MRHNVMHSDLVERSKLNRDDSQLFTCIVCARSFKTPDSLATHLKAHKHKNVENLEYDCKLCHDTFPTFSDILKHSKNHIENATHQVSSIKSNIKDLNLNSLIFLVHAV